MPYITRINLSKLTEKEKEQVIKALEYCRMHDKFQSFEYGMIGETVRIFSPDKRTARKRGWYFYKRFNLHFNIEYAKP